jgi:hypothetical protein
MTDEYRIGIDQEGSGHGLIEVLSGGTDENHEKSQSRQLVSWLRIPTYLASHWMNHTPINNL